MRGWKTGILLLVTLALASVLVAYAIFNGSALPTWISGPQGLPGRALYRTCEVEKDGFEIEVRLGRFNGSSEWRVLAEHDSIPGWTSLRYDLNFPTTWRELNSTLPLRQVLGFDGDWRGGYKTIGPRNYTFEISAYNGGPLAVAGAVVEVTHKDERTYSYELHGRVAPMTFGTLATQSNTVFPTGEVRGWQLISLEKTLFPPDGTCE